MLDMAKRSSEDTFSSVGQHSKKTRGPNDISVKFLLPNIVVGALLSRKAAALKRIRDQTCHNKEFILKISGKEQFYPGTENERMVAVAGPPPLVHRACCLLQDQIIDDPFLVNDPTGVNDMGPRQGQMMLAVSDRAASKIIGSRGAVVKDISSHFNIAISITPAKEVTVPDERVVTILGPSQNVFDALDPIIFQISQQEVQVSPEFDYYSQYNGSKEEVVKEKSKEENREKQESAISVPEEKSAMSKEPQQDDDDPKNIESSFTDNGATTVESCKSIEAEKEGKASEEKASMEKTSEGKVVDDNQNSEKNVKKILTKPRKDGKWFWQSERNSRPKWIWNENQKNNTHNMNHSQAYKGARGEGYGAGRGGRFW